MLRHLNRSNHRRSNLGAFFRNVGPNTDDMRALGLYGSQGSNARDQVSILTTKF